MQTHTGAVAALIDHVDATRGTRRAARATTAWRAADPMFDRFADPAGVAETMRVAGPAGQDRLLAALVRGACGR